MCYTTLLDIYIRQQQRYKPLTNYFKGKYVQKNNTHIYLRHIPVHLRSQSKTRLRSDALFLQDDILFLYNLFIQILL